jgi:hypothetical protein
MSRSIIFKNFRDILDKDKISLKQQLFLEKYVEKYYKIDNVIDRLLIYHGIGTGKTRTSIIIAEKIMKLNSKMKAIIILPARLKTNYIDELIPIICAKYPRELKKYNDPKISTSDKKKLLDFFDSIISKKYSIYSYEYIINLFKKSSNIKKTLEELTKNKILIIDEFHNLISNGIKETSINDINIRNKLPANPNLIRALIMRYISRFADKSCKMFFLTATPVFDNYLQFIELVKLLNVKPIDDKNLKSFKQIIPYIKGKISYYSLDDRTDFPEVGYMPEKIPLSKEQDRKMFKYQNENSSQDNETFLLKQRQVAISVYGFDKVDLVLKDLKEYAPKLRTLFSYITNKAVGKHLVYSNFITYCLHIIKKYLDNNGWINYSNPNKSSDYKSYKTYVLWDATLSDYDKQNIKSILNSKENMDGKIIKVILGSPSIKEGISFKHIQHFHQIDPVWNISAKQQIEGRCIRYKSHDDIPLKHKYLKRKVIIHNYISVPTKDGKIIKTCDQLIYDDIMPKKEVIINKILEILQKIAIDYYLYRKLSTSPKSSVISISSSNIIKPKVFKNIKKGNTCPVARRPVDDICKKEGYVIKINKHNDKCCYKDNKKDKKKIKKISSLLSIISSSKKKEDNYYLSDRIMTYKTFSHLFKSFSIDKCQTNRIDNIKLIENRLKNWVVFKAHINEQIPVIITLTIKKDILLMETLKELTECVIKNYSPHYQLYYNDIICDEDNANKYLRLLGNSNYNDGSLSLPLSLSLDKKYNITFFENFKYNGNLSTFIKINKLTSDNKLFSNAITQCLLSIMFYYSYLSYFKDEIISLEGISALDFICQKTEKGGYFKYNLYGKDYYVENLGFIFVLSFTNKQSKNSILDLHNKFDVIKSFIKSLNIFLYNIKQLVGNTKPTIIDKLISNLEKCNNTNKQLPDKLLAKTINTISSYVIIENLLVAYKWLIKDIDKKYVINPNNSFTISETYK